MNDHPCQVREGAGGLISSDWCIDRFAKILAAFPDHMTQQDAAHPELLLYSKKIGSRSRRTLEIYYTPFDWVNTSARVVLVGITPGPHQQHLAVRAAGNALRSGAGNPAAVQAALATAGFAGSMRATMTCMLDAIGLHAKLGIASCGALFAARSDLVAMTSAICHAAFVDGEPYRGSSPKIGNLPVLRSFVEQVLAANLAMVPDALVIPLGKAATSAVEMCVRSGAVDPARCLLGFPHPSGANGHRARQFEQARESMANQVQAWPGITR